MGKGRKGVSDERTGEIRSSTGAAGNWPPGLSVHIHPLIGGISSESSVCAAPCWADRGMQGWCSEEEKLLRVPAEVPLRPKARLLLRSDLLPRQRRRAGGPSRRAVPLQEGFDGERPAELHLAPLPNAASCRFGGYKAHLPLWASAPGLSFQLGGQLREELQDSFKMPPHHLWRDLTGVQLPVVPFTVQCIWDHRNLRKTADVKRSTNRAKDEPTRGSNLTLTKHLLVDKQTLMLFSEDLLFSDMSGVRLSINCNTSASNQSQVLHMETLLKVEILGAGQRTWVKVSIFSGAHCRTTAILAR